VFLILADEKIFLLYYFTPTAYATIDTTIIHHVYKYDFQSAFLFSTTGSWNLFAIKLEAVFGLVFFHVNGFNLNFILDPGRIYKLTN